LEAGRANDTLERIWEHMPPKEGQNVVAGLAVNPSDLLPRNVADYYMYTGSATAPPCTEGVIWYVLKTPVTISPKQIRAFAQLYPHDVRPVQPINGRIVKERE
jgi:carbonic anhydrase